MRVSSGFDADRNCDLCGYSVKVRRVAGEAPRNSAGFIDRLAEWFGHHY
jgi:hypothetical protein